MASVTKRAKELLSAPGKKEELVNMSYEEAFLEGFRVTSEGYKSVQVLDEKISLTIKMTKNSKGYWQVDIDNEIFKNVENLIR